MQQTDRERKPTYNTTYGLMSGVAIIALMLGLFLSRDLVSVISWLGALALMVAIPAIVMQGWLEHLVGVACPRCRTQLQLVGMKTFGDRFYRCPGCESRYRRSGIPIMAVFQDASDPVFDRYFRRKEAENPWTLPPELVDEDEVGEMSKTHGSLLPQQAAEESRLAEHAGEPLSPGSLRAP